MTSQSRLYFSRFGIGVRHLDGEVFVDKLYCDGLLWLNHFKLAYHPILTDNAIYRKSENDKEITYYNE